MKRKIKVFLIAFLSVIILTSCVQRKENNPKTDTLQNNEQKQKVTTEVETTKEIITAEKTLKEVQPNWTKVGSARYDIDDDKTEEEIFLYTSAEKDKNGDILWDDRQSWSLYVKDGDLFYNLYNDYIQNGNAYFELSNNSNSDENKPVIMLIEMAGSKTGIYTFSFIKEKSCFEKSIIYDTSKENASTNSIYSSIPEIK